MIPTTLDFLVLGETVFSTKYGCDFNGNGSFENEETIEIYESNLFDYKDNLLSWSNDRISSSNKFKYSQIRIFKAPEDYYNVVDNKVYSKEKLSSFRENLIDSFSKELVRLKVLSLANNHPYKLLEIALDLVVNRLKTIRFEVENISEESKKSSLLALAVPQANTIYIDESLYNSILDVDFDQIDQDNVHKLKWQIVLSTLFHELSHMVIRNVVSHPELDKKFFDFSKGRTRFKLFFTHTSKDGEAVSFQHKPIDQFKESRCVTDEQSKHYLLNEVFAFQLEGIFLALLVGISDEDLSNWMDKRRLGKIKPADILVLLSKVKSWYEKNTKFAHDIKLKQALDISVTLVVFTLNLKLNDDILSYIVNHEDYRDFWPSKNGCR